MDSGKDRKAALYAHLKSAVLTLGLAPGSDLDEARLSAEFGLSRTPLREVFRQLAGEGFLTLRENRGAKVSQMSYDTLRDFFLAAPMIYGAVMRLAAGHRTPDQLAQLQAAQDAFQAALATGDAAARALTNTRFHEITGEMAGNIYLLPSFQRLLIDHSRISMTFYRAGNPDLTKNQIRAAAQHEAIIAAIMQGDEAAAGQLAIDHWELSRGQIARFVMPDALDLPLGHVPTPT